MDFEVPKTHKTDLKQLQFWRKAQIQINNHKQAASQVLMKVKDLIHDRSFLGHFKSSERPILKFIELFETLLFGKLLSEKDRSAIEFVEYKMVEYCEKISSEIRPRGSVLSYWIVSTQYEI